ncbi:MAG: permease-like cell division protein FtsX [Methylophilus sp.]
MKHWLNQHLQAISLVSSRLKMHLVSTLLICAVIGVTLAIPSLIYVVFHNLSSLVTDVKKDTQISLFLVSDADEKIIYQVKQQLTDQPNIQSFIFVSKDKALDQLKEHTKNQDLLTSLDKNPLPHAFFIEPKSLAKEDINQLKTYLENISGVQEVMVDGEWMNRLNSLLKIGVQAIWIFGGLLCFALVAVISNTIRMQTLTHKEEIEVSELFGATKSFIRRPFLYMGTAYGLGGGLFACIILWGVIHLFNQTVVKIAQEYQSDFSLHFNIADTFLSMIIISASIGWLAAFIAVTMQSKSKI